MRRIEPADLQTPEELRNILLLPQVLDNQWVPISTMEQIAQHGGTRKDREGELMKLVRREYITSLFSATRLMVNRGYFINTRPLARDCSDPIARKALQTLLNEGAIIPCFYDEETPDQKPGFDHTAEDLAAWVDTFKGANPLVLRMSWQDQTTNAARNKRLARRFHEKCKSFEDLDAAPLHDGLNLPMNQQDEFWRRRREFVDFVRSKAPANGYISRNQLYSEFISANGSNVSECHYDFNKPYARELKQLVDVAYNTGLPDLLFGQLITPNDTINRSVLQEDAKRPGNQVEDMAGLAQLLGAIRLDEMLNLLNQEVQFIRFEELNLADVTAGRSMGEWRQYNESLRAAAAEDYLTTGADNRFRLRLEEAARRHTAFQQALFHSLGQREFDRRAHLVAHPGVFGLHLLLKIGGMEAVAMALDPTGESILEATALDQLEQMGEGWKQATLSLCFWDPRAKAVGTAWKKLRPDTSHSLGMIDLFHGYVLSTRKALGDFLALMSDMARRLTGNPMRTVNDLESPQGSHIAVKSESDES